MGGAYLARAQNDEHLGEKYFQESRIGYNFGTWVTDWGPASYIDSEYELFLAATRIFSTSAESRILKSELQIERFDVKTKNIKSNLKLLNP